MSLKFPCKCTYKNKATGFLKVINYPKASRILAGPAHDLVLYPCIPEFRFLQCDKWRHFMPPSKYLTLITVGGMAYSSLEYLRVLLFFFQWVLLSHCMNNINERENVSNLSRTSNSTYPYTYTCTCISFGNSRNHVKLLLSNNNLQMFPYF